MVPNLAMKENPMTKLSDTQAILLSAAAQRAGGNLLPLPGSLRGGAAVKVVGALLARGLAREEVIDRPTRADSALNTVWRNEDDGRAVLLIIPRPRVS
jgi:ABC-type thiamine transport system ATPase subunit